MSTAIQFEGQEYASIEGMPPDIRKAYEKAQAAAKLKAKYKADGAAGQAVTGHAQHPWDVNTGAGGIAVPAGFEGVTGLGPAEQVHLVKLSGLVGLILMLILSLGFLLPGLFILVVSLFPTLSTTIFGGSALVGGIIFTLIGGLVFRMSAQPLWSLPVGIKAVVIYHNGFAFGRRGSVHVWPWTEIATIFSNETFHSTTHHTSWTDRVYTLSKKNGEKVILTSYYLENIGQLIEVIKRRALHVLLPPFEQAYRAGQPVTFGPVTVSREGGIEIGGKNFAWSDVLKVEVKDGNLLVTMKQTGVLGGHHSVRASTIPNIEALCQLIGLDPWMIDLAHL